MSVFMPPDVELLQKEIDALRAERDALQETIRRLQNRVEDLEYDRQDHHTALQSVLFREKE